VGSDVRGEGAAGGREAAVMKSPVDRFVFSRTVTLKIERERSSWAYTFSSTSGVKWMWARVKGPPDPGAGGALEQDVRARGGIHEGVYMAMTLSSTFAYFTALASITKSFGEGTHFVQHSRHNIAIRRCLDHLAPHIHFVNWHHYAAIRARSPVLNLEVLTAATELHRDRAHTLLEHAATEDLPENRSSRSASTQSKMIIENGLELEGR
jgi:hypothetical protein